MLATNPYEAVDLDSFTIKPIGVMGDRHIFRVALSEHSAFEAIVFRGALMDFLFMNAKDDWHLGNDDRYITIDERDAVLALSGRDADSFRKIYWLD
jgi:hypothetical protein